MATHSSLLAWRVPQTEEPDRLQSRGSYIVRHDWGGLAWMHAQGFLARRNSQDWLLRSLCSWGDCSRPLTTSPGDSLRPEGLVRLQWKDSHLWSRSSWPDTKSSSAEMLNLPVFRTRGCGRWRTRAESPIPWLLEEVRSTQVQRWMRMNPGEADSITPTGAEKRTLVQPLLCSPRTGSELS